MSTENASEWYTKWPQFTNDAGTLAFGKPLGSVFELPNGFKYSAPGIMAFTFTPTVGYSADLSSPINMSATRFQTYLRTIMKAASDYDAADTMMYLMAVDSLYMYHSMMRRAYETAQLYSPLNKYYPRRLLQLQRIDPSVADNLANFRAYINKFAISLASFPVPKEFAITTRHKWMCEGAYYDAPDSTRAQTYLFVPMLFWQYNNTVTTGSQLDPVWWQENNTATITLHTLEQIISIGNSLLNAIINDQDMTDIAGDLLRAYGKGNCRTIEEVRDMDSIQPIYSEEVLTQIENMTIVGDYPITYTPVISQNPNVNNGAIIFQPTFKAPSTVSVGDETYYPNPLFMNSGVFLNMHHESPSPTEVIEATRLTVCTKGVSTNIAPKTATSSQYSPTVFGADVINRAWTMMINDQNPAAASTLTWYNQVTTLPSSGATVSDVTDLVNRLSLSEAFDWAPMLYQYSITTGGVVDLVTIAADVDNLTWATAEQIENMHIASMFSLFDVPQVAHAN